MNERLKLAKERSQTRKRLIMQTCGMDTIEDLKSVLGSGAMDAAPTAASVGEKDPHRKSSSSSSSSEAKSRKCSDQPIDSVEVSRNLLTKPLANPTQPSAPSIPVQWTSSTFLKGTQSSNPHNDYCQHFVDTGQRPQNFIRDIGLADRFVEYPKLRELIQLKDTLIRDSATPPMYLQASNSNSNKKINRLIGNESVNFSRLTD